jgi:predicted phage terminase large subunit-like protein
LSNKFSRRARSVARDPKTAEVFPDLKLDPERTAVEEWETTAGGGYKAVGVGSALTGSGAHILLIDDPVKDHVEADSETHRDNVWEWYDSTAGTRLMPGGGVIVIMTRWHDDDLAGRLLKRSKEDPEADQWEVLSFPAIAEEDEHHRRKGEALHPERYGLRALMRRMKNMAHRFWVALYQQRPTVAEGQILKRAWWKEYRLTPKEMAAQCDRVVQSWDCTFKDTDGTDFVVGQVWGLKGADFYLLDEVRDRMDLPTTVKTVRSLSVKWPEAELKLVEDKANGPAVVATLKREIPGLVEVSPIGSKTARATAASVYLESGNTWLPEPKHLASVHDFVDECAAFPAGAHDDRVDAYSQAINRLKAHVAIVSDVHEEVFDLDELV